MSLLAIDPGPLESAFVVYDNGAVPEYGKLANPALRFEFHELLPTVDDFAIEMIASYGMPVGAEVFVTCVWIGRFVERWVTSRTHSHHRFVYRKDVKLHLCGDSRAKDQNIRRALIDRYGGQEKAIGRKKSPGPLYGLTGDCWAALAVAITAAETTP